MGINDKTGGAACYPLNREARRAWDDEQMRAHRAPQTPEPEVRARLAADHELPLAVHRLLKAAKEGGWRTLATYARGTRTGSRGQALRVEDSVLVKFYLRDPASQHRNRYLIAAWAHWSDGAFEVAYINGKKATFRELNKTIRTGALPEPVPVVAT